MSISLPGQIADELVTLLESPAAQTALVAAITAGEVPLQTAIDAAINGLSGKGVLGVVFTAIKGSIVAEINAQFAAYTPETIAAFLTKLAQEEAKNLGG